MSPNGKKIPQDLLAIFCCDRFGMELNSERWVLPVPHRHDCSVFSPSSNVKAHRERRAFNDQRMVTRGEKRRGNSAEKIAPVVMD